MERSEKAWDKRNLVSVEELEMFSFFADIWSLSVLATAKIFRDVRDSQVSVNDNSVRHCKGCHKGDGQFVWFKCAQKKKCRLCCFSFFAAI